MSELTHTPYAALLAQRLQVKFPGLDDFSATNLWRMWRFYEAYASDEKLAPMAQEIGWNHNRVILEKYTDPQEREFYLCITRRIGWTKNVLVHRHHPLQVEGQDDRRVRPARVGQADWRGNLSHRFDATQRPSEPVPCFQVGGRLLEGV